MNIDKNALDRLASLDDEELRAKILQIAAACGADTARLSRRLSDMPKLKKSISSMSESEINSVLKTVGEENYRIIADSINDKGERG